MNQKTFHRTSSKSIQNQDKWTINQNFLTMEIHCKAFTLASSSLVHYHVSTSHQPLSYSKYEKSHEHISSDFAIQSVRQMVPFIAVRLRVNNIFFSAVRLSRVWAVNVKNTQINKIFQLWDPEKFFRSTDVNQSAENGFSVVWRMAYSRYWPSGKKRIGKRL